MELSGALAADTNTVNGTLVKYAEPPEARKPKKKWRLYVFKVKCYQKIIDNSDLVSFNLVSTNEDVGYL